MATFNNASLKKRLKNMNFPLNEFLVISEIFECSKRKSSKSNRYSEDWILLCLLLHMRSPAAYRLLRENNILPLPCTSTIRR